MRGRALRTSSGYTSFALSLAAVACSKPPPPPHAAPPPPVVALGDAAAFAPPAVPDVDALAARQPALAPGMREASRGVQTLPARIEVPGGTADVCLRAILASRAPLAVALLDASGRVIEIAEASPLATLGSRGPVCLTRGTTAYVEAQGSGLVQWVLWMNP